MRHLAAFVLVPSMGCFLVPSMYLDESEVTDRYAIPDAEHPGSLLEVEILPITGELLRTVKKPEAAAKVEVAPSYTYRIGAHDVLNITVFDHPELTIPAGQYRSAEEGGYKVSADGTLFFPYVGVLQVGGLTTDAVRLLLTDKLRDHVERPQLTVRVAAFHSQKVHVLGEVLAPGVFPLTDVPLTALQAIHLAKGFTPEADPQHVSLVRGNDRQVLDVRALYDQGDLAQDRVLVGGDVLQVPDRQHNRIFVIGEVTKPSSALMHRGRMSLAEALGEAGGLDPETADPGAIYVFRHEGRLPGIYRLDAESPDAMLLAVQFPLQPLDVVFVSSHGLARWNRAVSQILPTIQALWQTATLPSVVWNLVERP